jgi:uncharacterized protein YecE (DUF72 family)
MADIRLGTSGWSYEEWVGPFYESRKTPKLTYYSQVFPTVEIDSTFYAYPSERTVHGWLRRTGPDFTFCAKLPQVITHEKALRLDEGVEEDVERFLEVMQPLSLNGKLLAVLIQLPPSLRRDLDLLESFFRILPKNTRFAIEFRHRSWWNEETWRLLSKYRIANTIVDEPLLPPDPIVTTDFAYIRWHGRGKRPWYNYHYSTEELKPWVPKVKDVMDKTKATVGYFNNHFHGYAVENCLQVLEMLGVATPRQVEVRRRAEQHINAGMVGAKSKEALTAFLAGGEASRDMSVESLLLGFMDRGRLRRALEIGDSEIEFMEKKPNLVRAKIREYTVTIDLDEKAILHDCADWDRQMSEKLFCKHVGKTFLSLPDHKAGRILRGILSEKDSWRFLTIS